MSRKIPKELYTTVYNFYTKELEKGTPITKIANLFNAHFGTQFAESSLRNRYEYQRDLENIEYDIMDRLEAIEKAEHKLALAELRMVEEQKKIQRQRSTIQSKVRYNADKVLVAEIYKQVYGEELDREPKPFLHVKRDVQRVPNIYNISDVHLGYSEDGYYNLETAIHRIEQFFSYVSNEVKTKELDHVIISDTGDQIEGSTLRVTQLATISEVMSKQAVLYANEFTKGLKELSKQHPDTQLDVYFVDEDNHSQIRVMGSGRGETREMMAKVIANDIRKTIETAQEFGGMQNVNFNHGGVILATYDNVDVAFLHGHQVRGNNPKTITNFIEETLDIRPDVVIHGHFHNFKLTRGTVRKGFQQTVISVPAVVGDTSYSREKLALTTVPTFTIIQIDKQQANAKTVTLE